MARSTRAPRVIRGVVAASVATFVALLSHVIGGGPLPGWVGIVVPWVLAVAVSTLLVGRRLSVWRLSLAVVASQFLFHGLFVLGLFGTEASSTPPGLHDHHHLAPSAAPAVTGMAHPETAMWVAHGIAALLTIAVLHRGEWTARRLLALAVEVVVALSRRLHGLTTVWVAALPPRAPFFTEARTVAPWGWFPSTTARRGPPALLTV